MKINFVLPSFNRAPGGGSKIIYQIANYLSERGYDVCIYHVLGTRYTYQKNRPFWLRKILSIVLDKGIPKPNWIELHPKIKTLYVDHLKDKTVVDADYIVFTWWALAEDIAKLSLKKGKKIDLVQGYEIWNGNVSKVHQSYNFHNILYVCISDYIVSLVKKYNQYKEPVLLNLAVEDKYKLTKSIEERNPYAIAMLYTPHDDVKGTIYGLEALKILKEKYPQIEVNLFGIVKRHERIPDWMNYEQKPTNLPEIYNSNSIFFSPSLTEGWALPPVESMKCGCLFIGSDISGHETYLKNDFTLKFKPKDIEDMVNQIAFAINNQEKRVEMASQGNQFVSKFSWKKTIDNFEEILKSHSK